SRAGSKPRFAVKDIFFQPPNLLSLVAFEMQESEIMKDWCNTDGARRLKDKIAEYWADRGYEVEVDLVDAGFVPAMRSARTDVRSNMVNGMPRRKLVNVNEVRSEYRPD
ncbi:MAG: hypothetical protein AAF582_05555, partial [Pseudomonadota bacterium]